MKSIKERYVIFFHFGGTVPLTQKRQQKGIPSVEELTELMYNIYLMERITFNMGTQKDTFFENCSIKFSN